MKKNYLASDFLKSRARNVLARIFTKNTVGAYVLQADKGLFAFLVLPFLAYRLGIATFGVFSTFLSLTVIAGLLVDWGFSQTAIRFMAIAKVDQKAGIAGTVILARLILFVPVSLIILIGLFLAPQLEGRLVLSVFSVLTVFSGAISPVFLFQGEEKSFEIGIVTLALRLLSLLIFFAFVTNSDDLSYAFAIYALFTLLGSGLGWLILVRKYKFKLNLPSFREAGNLIADGCDFAVANFGTAFYGNGSVFLLSFVCPSPQVGAFSLALAFTRGLCSILTPVSQSYFPKVSRLYEDSFATAREALRKALALQIVSASALVVVAFMVFIYVVPIVIQRDLHELPQLMSILLPTIIFTVVSSMLVLFVLIPLGMDRFYRNLVVGSALFGSGCMLWMGYLFQGYGAAVSILIIETGVCLLIVRQAIQALNCKFG